MAMKTFLKLTDTDGETVLVDLDKALVIEPVTYRQDDGRMTSGTLFTYAGGVERQVATSFAQVLTAVATNASVVQ